MKISDSKGQKRYAIAGDLGQNDQAGPRSWLISKKEDRVEQQHAQQHHMVQKAA